MKRERCAGILMPISALPSGEGIGTLGEGAYAFIDFLRDSGMKIWQVLPLNPTNYGDSPYQSCCSNALNYYFIDLKLLVRDHLLTEDELTEADLGGDVRRVDYGKQFTRKIALLRRAFSRFDPESADFKAFVSRGNYADFASFMALKCKFGHRAWEAWDAPYRDYDERVVAAYLAENRQEYLFWQFTQFVFLRQWQGVKAYANKNGIRVMGDIPLYLAYDSVEMWKYGDKLFRVDSHRRPSCVAGVPPDAFSEDGQLWGNPLYDWEKMKEDGYAFWNGRIRACLNLFDILRIDHFRGFDRYYAIPAGETTAKNGHWEDGPKEELFADKRDYDIVAEDLGVLDDGVIRLMDRVGYPGMKILEFAFDGSPANEHKPSNYSENFVCYTGTHDNMPLRQYIDDLPAEYFDRFQTDLTAECEKLGLTADLTSSESMCRTVIRLAFASVAFAVVIPMWDLLAMGGEARMNLPSVVSDKNWSFRFAGGDFTPALAGFLKDLAVASKRV